VRSCYLIFPSIEHVQRRRTEGPSCLRTWETGELRSPDKVIGNKRRNELTTRHARMSEVRPSDAASDFSHSWEVGICPALSERRGGLWLSDTCTSDQTYLWRSVLSRESEVATPTRSPPVTSLARRSGLARRVRPSSWECMPRASSACCASSNALGRSDPLFLLGLTSCGWSPPGVRPAGAPLGCGRRRAGPRSTEHGARERREVSLVEIIITTGVHRGAGGTWGAKKNPPNWPWTMDAIRSMCTPNGIPRGAG
jgi:hypothetical protein